MASPCEIHVEVPKRAQAEQLVQLAMAEALRIEQALSRYRKDNLVWEINNSQGQAVEVDTELGGMLDFADTCFDISDGLFDITSGVLRKAWLFDGSANLPLAEEVDVLLPYVGWRKAQWRAPFFSLPQGMQIDLGGIGKEYAVDRCIEILDAASKGTPCLVNFGGDLHTNKAPRSKSSWQVGIEATGAARTSTAIELQKGAITTSGDAHRYLLKDGIRYGHVLNPRTGWPVEGAPKSVTVAGDSCLQAGILSTLAALNGADAERFLNEQEVRFWCQW